jgi:hypothetical protein
VFLLAISFTGIPPQKEKGNKGENSEKGNQNQKGNNKTDNASRGNNDQDRSDDDRASNKGRSDNNNQGNNKDDQGNNKKNGNSDNRNSNDYTGSDKNDKGKDKGNGKSRRESIKWDRDDNINWGFDNNSSRKGPKDQKKVSICHNTGNNNYPVTINVSENALKAHMNHGDQVGNCTTNYSDRWPANYIRTRENVYNNYENTWETMSYSESLLRFAADKLLGIKSTFQAQRPSLTSQDIQRKEALILELQNNVNSLENQLAVTRQRTDGLNINISL